MRCVVLAWPSPVVDQMVVLERRGGDDKAKWKWLANTEEDFYVDSPVRRKRTYCYRMRLYGTADWSPEACVTMTPE